MLPREEQVDALFGNEVPVSEKSEKLMAKSKLGFVGIDVRDGMPLSVREENATRDDGMDMRNRNTPWSFPPPPPISLALPLEPAYRGFITVSSSERIMTV